jgi:hypothetical protein
MFLITVRNDEFASICVEKFKLDRILLEIFERDASKDNTQSSMHLNEIFKLLYNLIQQPDLSESNETPKIKDFIKWITPMLSLLSRNSDSIKLNSPYTSMINVLLNLPLTPDIDYSIIDTCLIPLFVDTILEAFPETCSNVDKASPKDLAGVSIDDALVPLAALLARIISLDKSVRDKAKMILAPDDL